MREIANRLVLSPATAFIKRASARNRQPGATPTPSRSRPGAVHLQWARSAHEVREAQRLRYRVFCEESGAQVQGRSGLDEDEFDAHCEHLLVRDTASLEVVGTYRILPPHAAHRVGRLYAEQEFDLSRLAPLRPTMVEVGRSCVHAQYRNGAVIMALWSGLAHYMRRHGYQTMLGCASVSMSDGGHNAANVWDALAPSSLVSADYRAFAHVRLPVDELRTAAAAMPPALLKGYLRLGARICGEPAWDAHFNTADFLTLFHLSDMDPRYASHFLKTA